MVVTQTRTGKSFATKYAQQVFGREREVIDAVRSDLEKVRASAGSEVEPKVQAVQDAIDATQAGLTNLGEGGAAEIATALSDLSIATTNLLTSLEGGPCD